MPRVTVPNVLEAEEGQVLAVSGKTMQPVAPGATIEAQADVSDLGAFTIAADPLLLVNAAQAASVQESVNALGTKVNAILAALRSAGILEA